MPRLPQDSCAQELSPQISREYLVPVITPTPTLGTMAFPARLWCSQVSHPGQVTSGPDSSPSQAWDAQGCSPSLDCSVLGFTPSPAWWSPLHSSTPQLGQVRWKDGMEGCCDEGKQPQGAFPTHIPYCVPSPPPPGMQLTREQCQVPVGRMPCVAPQGREGCLQAGCCYDDMDRITPCYYGNTGRTPGGTSQNPFPVPGEGIQGDGASP